MSIQRYISTSFWDDDWIQSLDPLEKLLYLYLMTNPLTNIAGVYKIADRRISFDTGFNADTIKMILGKFEKAGKAYRIDEFIVIPSWPKHQKWEIRAKIKTGIDNILKKLPVELLQKLKDIGYRYPIDTLCIPYTYPVNYSDLDSDSDIDSDSDLKKNVGTSVPADGSNEPPLSESQKSAIELSELLLTSHRKEFPDYLSGKKDAETISRWAKDIEKLIRIDKKAPEIIRQVILWVKTPGNFWFSNIESGSKLREKFERLYGEMVSKQRSPPKGGNTRGLEDKESLTGLKPIIF